MVTLGSSWVGCGVLTESISTMASKIVPPTVTIVSKPDTTISTSSASFTFSGKDSAGATVTRFECSLNGAKYSSCTSPLNLTSQVFGANTLSVKGIDVKGVESTPVSYSWNLSFSISVAPAYPNNGGNWGKYVKNDGVTIYEAADLACTLDYGYNQCLHGGEMRKVTLGGFTSCDGLSLSDELGAFMWDCKVLMELPPFLVEGLSLRQSLLIS